MRGIEKRVKRANDLKAHRLRLGLSQSEIARRMRAPRSTYVKWENGDRWAPDLVFSWVALVDRVAELDETINRITGGT